MFVADAAAKDVAEVAAEDAAKEDAAEDAAAADAFPSRAVSPRANPRPELEESAGPGPILPTGDSDRVFETSRAGDPGMEAPRTSRARLDVRSRKLGTAGMGSRL